MISESPSKPRGFIYTFYSYKGGVGRSMALVNTGVLLALAEGADKKPPRILLVDWDLEAPGLEVHFQRCEQVTLKGDPKSVPGIVDLLEARAQGRDLPWRKCLLQAAFAGVSLDVLSSGAKTPKGETAKDYRQRVQQLDWAALFEKHDIGNYLDRLRKEWIEAYDFVLIDSRTGITDIGDICTVLLPDALVLFFVTNYQNIDGVSQIVERARAARSRLPVDRSRLIAVPVPARDETQHEYDKSMQWRNIYAEKLGYLYGDWLPKTVQPIDALSRLYIPYVTNWSFGERIPVLENARERSDPTTIGAAYFRLANLLRSRLDWSAVAGEAKEEIASALAELNVERSKTAEIENLLALEKARARRNTAIAGALATAVIAVIGWFNLAYLKERYYWFIAVRPYVLTTEQVRTLAPRDSFKECAKACPEMVVVLAGTFTMGSPNNEAGRGENEGPQRAVKIPMRFAVSKFEVTFDEWDTCVSFGPCRPVSDDSGWGRGQRPVINVDWNDAKQYVDWLSGLTGNSYRLLSEAEWEYAARANSSTAYSFGDDPAQLGRYGWYVENSGGETHPVGKKEPNGFGLRDMHGNVWEWVEDCYRENDQWARTDVASALSGDCSSRVARGGSWLNMPADLRSATRYGDPVGIRTVILGFRVGRTLFP